MATCRWRRIQRLSHCAQAPPGGRQVRHQPRRLARQLSLENHRERGAGTALPDLLSGEQLLLHPGQLASGGCGPLHRRSARRALASMAQAAFTGRCRWAGRRASTAPSLRWTITALTQLLTGPLRTPNVAVPPLTCPAEQRLGRWQRHLGDAMNGDHVGRRPRGSGRWRLRRLQADNRAGAVKAATEPTTGRTANPAGRSVSRD